MAKKTDKADKVKVNEATFAGDRAMLESAASEVVAATQQIGESVLKIKTGGVFPQSLITCAVHLKSIGAATTKTLESIRTAALAHADADGEFGLGDFQVTIAETDKASVPWKDLALKYAKLYHEAAGKSYNEAKFVAKQVKNNTTKVKSVSYDPAQTGRKPKRLDD